ncbi:MAG: hypothetical protein EOO77_14230 [Oxalobacteraceae bacterium]|nr:MAG: hypothetical protein EOO77_14230 [Oxalobacteraceae bacterium]
MFDDDEPDGCVPSHGCAVVTDSHVAAAMAEADGLNLPFDLSNVVDYNPFVFGRVYSDPVVGRWVRFHGSEATNLGGQTVPCAPGIARIVGHECGRYVLGFEDQINGAVYLGWVLPTTFDFIDIHHEHSRWTH